MISLFLFYLPFSFFSLIFFKKSFTFSHSSSVILTDRVLAPGGSVLLAPDPLRRPPQFALIFLFSAISPNPPLHDCLLIRLGV